MGRGRFQKVHKEDARVIFEDFRCAVAVMDVAVDDGDALESIFDDGVHDACGDVV
mgnify:CR=1 FL=1